MTPLQAKFRRLQNWFIVFAVVVVFLGILVPTLVIFLTLAQGERVQKEVIDTQLSVVCESIRNQRTTLLGINQLRREIGLRNPIPLPEVPVECDDSS